MFKPPSVQVNKEAFASPSTVLPSPTSGLGPLSTPPGPLKSDGTLDMRFSANKAAYGGGGSGGGAAYGGGGGGMAAGPLKANGTPDMRFSANKIAYGGGSRGRR